MKWLRNDFHAAQIQRNKHRKKQTEEQTEEQRNKKTDVDAVQVVSVHNGSLEELDLREMPLKQAFQLQTRFLPGTQSNSANSHATQSLCPRKVYTTKEYKAAIRSRKKTRFKYSFQWF